MSSVGTSNSDRLTSHTAGKSWKYLISVLLPNKSGGNEGRRSIDTHRLRVQPGRRRQWAKLSTWQILHILEFSARLQIGTTQPPLKHWMMSLLWWFYPDCSCRLLLHQCSNQGLACQTMAAACLLINLSSASVGQGEQGPLHKDISAQQSVEWTADSNKFHHSINLLDQKIESTCCITVMFLCDYFSLWGRGSLNLNTSPK